ncbi:hypothetical protein SB748_28235 [Rhizobium sp. SIMBA_035]
MKRIVDAHLIRLVNGLNLDDYLPLPAGTWDEAVKVAKLRGLISAEPGNSPPRYKRTLAGELYLFQHGPSKCH